MLVVLTVRYNSLCSNFVFQSIRLSLQNLVQSWNKVLSKLISNGLFSRGFSKTGRFKGTFWVSIKYTRRLIKLKKKITYFYNFTVL